VPGLHDPTFLASDGFLARRLARPLVRFLDVEASGGVLLLVATAAALVWANSPWSTSYEDLWETTLSVRVGDFEITEDLRHWVNDGLMALFFFVVGLEIKRELVVGQLASASEAALPAIAALGGMVVPAAVYLVINGGGVGGAGWGIPMATDIAFAVGVLALLGDRIPPSLKVLLVGLAIADDIGAILVIAVAYTEEISLEWLAVAAAGLGLVVVLRRFKVVYAPVYLVVGVGVWVATFESGVHATIAGVALGLLAPARPLMPQPEADRIAERLSSDHDVTAAEVQEVSFELRNSVSVAERLEESLHPWTSYVVVPLFALANAGIVLSGAAIRDAATSPVTLGVVAGLVIGKLVGITAFAWLAVRFRLGRLPPEVGWREMIGMAAVAGIGFTVSIFVTGLAFDDSALQDESKIGVLIASTIAAALGTALLLRRNPQAEEPQS
jgi:Na+:H+ antiporter, NhaA family